MATLQGYYLNPHQSQYGHSTRLSHMGCTPTSGANGANAATGGKVAKTGDEILALIPPRQEQNPDTPGWSLVDLDNAMLAIHVPFERRFAGWDGVLTALNNNLYVVLQGDSDRFGNNTCSGAFDGDHCIGVHPASRIEAGQKQFWIDDPICPGGRWENVATLLEYAKKFNPSINYGVFTTSVPKVAPVTVTLRYGGIRLYPPQNKVIDIPAGRYANVRTRPTTAAPIVARIKRTGIFRAYQMTHSGQLLAGSRVWYGNADGSHWLHSTAF